MARIGAIGYLRRDIAGPRQHWDEIQMRSLAKRLGYDLRKTIAFGAHTDNPAARLRSIANSLGVATVIVPSLAHFDGGEVPASLRGATVITVSDNTSP
ncbi:hypothetical protein NDR87_34230 [Nocardia sp. CDC159]|uniref:Uncharacterized protein n=1 Tax=Nocardia pulmonis TaxID=2951408 RepID=A0A9X2J0H1_9NOCA|nr:MULTISPECIES: hypothetical protein [Nocardia]MCM6778553.1 hypothetical protein [Nocardia pulmonis]MCM6791442.1 hypothetical protein [Nocardia sp. CDC159]